MSGTCVCADVSCPAHVCADVSCPARVCAEVSYPPHVCADVSCQHMCVLMCPVQHVCVLMVKCTMGHVYTTVPNILPQLNTPCQVPILPSSVGPLFNRNKNVVLSFSSHVESVTLEQERSYCVDR